MSLMDRYLHAQTPRRVQLPPGSAYAATAPEGRHHYVRGVTPRETFVRVFTGKPQPRHRRAQDTSRG